MAVIESLALRHFLSSYSPNHLAPIAPWQGKRTVETAPPARSGKSARMGFGCTVLVPRVLHRRSSKVGGPSVRQSWGECSADISSARNCGSFPLARLTRFSKIVVGEEASVIVSFQVHGKDGPDRGGKQQVPLPVPGSRCTGTEPLARRAARTGSQGVHRHC